MPKVKDMSRGGWILVGVVVALLLVPTAAGAATLYNGIMGTSGNRADVSPTSQLLTAEAAPSSLYHNVVSAGTSETVLARPPSGHALIVTGLSVDFFAMNAPDHVTVYVGSSTCSGLVNIAIVDSATEWNGSGYVMSGGMQSVPISPGIAIPAADRLCGHSSSSANYVDVSGYSVPSSAVTAPH